jgi:hypothetical protein
MVCVPWCTRRPIVSLSLMRGWRRRELVLEGAEILVATVVPAGPKWHRIRVPVVVHIGAAREGWGPLRSFRTTCDGLVEVS